MSTDRVPSLGMVVRTEAVAATSARDGEPGPFPRLRHPFARPHRSFDVIIVSATERSANKVGLCEAALAHLGFAGGRQEAPQIDNRVDLVGAWEEAGGAGHWFRTDKESGRDFPALLDGVP
jgi:hypothetical protein